MKENKVVDKIMSLIEKYGNEYYGENITQLEHMVQAAELAKNQGYDQEIILAAFLHDIGHLCALEENHGRMGDYGIVDHELLGAKFLSKNGFSLKVTELVDGHVLAKRYLAFKNSKYYSTLSKASKATLTYQGGILNSQEAAIFEKDELFDLKIQIRIWDDQAKKKNYAVSDITYLKKMMLNHLENQTTSKNKN